MEAILAAFHLNEPDSLKRAIAAGLGGLVTLGINPFLASKGLPGISDANLLAFAGLVSTFVLQSGYKSTQLKLAEAERAGQAAAAAIQTPADAAAALADKPEAKP